MSDVTRIKVLLVDDNLLFRDELVPRLEGEEDIEVVGEASNASEALDKVDRLNPDVVLMENKDAVKTRYTEQRLYIVPRQGHGCSNSTCTDFLRENQG